jgi:hypothetical protein
VEEGAESPGLPCLVAGARGPSASTARLTEKWKLPLTPHSAALPSRYLALRTPRRQAPPRHCIFLARSALLVRGIPARGKSLARHSVSSLPVKARASSKLEAALSLPARRPPSTAHCRAPLLFRSFRLFPFSLFPLSNRAFSGASRQPIFPGSRWRASKVGNEVGRSVEAAAGGLKKKRHFVGRRSEDLAGFLFYSHFLLPKVSSDPCSRLSPSATSFGLRLFADTFACARSTVHSRRPGQESTTRGAGLPPRCSRRHEAECAHYWAIGMPAAKISRTRRHRSGLHFASPVGWFPPRPSRTAAVYPGPIRRRVACVQMQTCRVAQRSPRPALPWPKHRRREGPRRNRT